ncbi:MAG TPA: TlpA disulfide reductase family protein, partial [Thermomicrobiales bacterium]|nr:TlpA disulfide reductase family protein [Thermomicrobiales bacterium]
MADAHVPEPTAQPSTPTRGVKPNPGKPSSIFDQPWPRLALVLVIVLGIVGVTFAVGQKEGWTSIGDGGENAQLLPKVGQKAPELITATSDGSPVFLSTLIGHPVWLNFWGSWCEPCQAEMPEIEAAYKVLQPQGVVMLAISQKEDVQTSVQYAEAAGATYPIMMDPAEALSGIDPNDPSMPPALRSMIQQTATWQV